MKKLLVVLFLFISIPTMGQELTKYFAGVLYTGSYDRDLKVSHTANFRLAGEFKVSDFCFKGIYTSENKNLLGFSWDKEISDNTSVSVGFRSRPITFLNRPHPISAPAQFEPYGTSIIPGSSIGGLLTQKISGVIYTAEFIIYPMINFQNIILDLATTSVV